MLAATKWNGQQRRWSTGPLAILCVALLVGCSERPQVIKTLTLPPLKEPLSAGSLWQEENGRAYLYEDLRAMRMGDILTIKIVEKFKGTKSGDTKAEREQTADTAVTGQATGIPFFGIGQRLLNSLGVNASSKNSFAGKGNTNREDTLTGTMSATVIELMPNGDLRIKGTREVKVNMETQKMTISGVVRRVDVDTKNTVLSTAIADAHIEYAGLGVVDDVQHPGWLVRILDWISPF